MIAICIHSALLLLLFLLIFLLFLRKPLQSQRRFEKVLLSILIVLFSLLGARHTPNLENLVLRYASPESAFQYLGRGDYIGSISGENEVVAISSGNSNSMLRLSVSGDRYRADALPVQTSSATFENYERGSIVSVTTDTISKSGCLLRGDPPVSKITGRSFRCLWHATLAFFPLSSRHPFNIIPHIFPPCRSRIYLP